MAKSDLRPRVIKLLSVFLLFASMMSYFLRFELRDYDFWWHIATGRYILTEGHLPDKDPFSFTSNLQENKNPFPDWEKTILKQYWLSQVIFYLIYDYADTTGIVILRSILIIMTLALVFYMLQRWAVSLPVSFVFVFALFTVLQRSTGERPVLFTIFFTALVFFLLERFKERRDNKIFFLSPLMLLWANLHGGFILGVIIIAVFMLVEGVKIILKKASYSRREIMLFYSATITALGFSAVNPTGWDAFFFAFSSKYAPLREGIHEYYPPFSLYKNKLMSIHYGYLFLILSYGVILILRNKQIDPSHIILLSGSLVMSLSAVRFMIFYTIIGTMVIGREMDVLMKSLLKARFPEKLYNRILSLLNIAALFSAIFFFIGFFKPEISSNSFVPRKAVDFIEENRLSGNMFNEYAHGGYILWRLYPWKKIFIDSRALNIIVKTEYSLITEAMAFDTKEEPSMNKKPLWENLLNHYRINFVFLPLLDMYSQILPVIFELAESNNWVAVYCDYGSVIFVRNSEQNKHIIQKFKISKNGVYEAIIATSAKVAMYNKNNPRALISMGDVFYRMGKLNDALTAYRYAFIRMPSPVTKGKIDKIESELKRKTANF